MDEIYCTLPGTNDEKIVRLLNFAEKHMIRFYIVPEFYRNLKKSLVMDVLESIPLMTVRREPLQAAYNRALKRAFDILFSTVILVTIFPILYIVVGIMIKLSSPGPILFKQKKTGLYGQDFRCYKFRTMKVNAQADSLQAVKDDPRKTKVGDFLVVGLTEDDFGSLTSEQMQKFEEQFHQPQMFVRMGRSIMAIPVPDDMVKKMEEKAAKPQEKSKPAPDRDSL